MTRESPSMVSPQAEQHLIEARAAEVLAGLGDQSRELFARAALGIDIEEFLEANPVGIFLAHIAATEREHAAEDLIKAMSQRPEDIALHRKHHHRIELCDQFKNWLSDAIAVGQEAQRELKAHESTDPT